MTGFRPARATLRALATTAVLVAVLLPVPAAAASFVTFETGQVRPLALSPDGTRLFAVNTPDDRLEIFAVGIGGGLTHTGAVPVGMEPIAVAARTNTEVWVVNHLSDSVSIVDVGSVPPRVVRTLLVGDEPRDLVFAGPGGNRAFITTAHRGQNSPVDPQLLTPGVGRADVWVFDALALGATLGGTPLTIVTLFGDTPRALAATPDGSTVYAAVFHSGNRTTTVPEGAVCNGGSTAPACLVGGLSVPGGLPAPNANIPEGITGPETGLIVKFNTTAGQWQDQLGRNWNNAVKFTLPDKDVFAIDANANPPAETSFFTGVGTVLFNMIVNPASGKVYVSNTEARNEVRFEGPGGGGSTVRGRLHLARITVLGAGVTPIALNKHINYGVVPSPAGVKEKSLATPLEMAVTSDGAKLYVAAFGSSKIGTFDTGELESDSFVPDEADQIPVSGGGPSGLVLDEAVDRLYAFTRFDNSISVIDTTTDTEIDHLPVYNPEPAKVQVGRPVLYDALETSSNGEAACGACHVFADFDSLAWDLGNPDDFVLNNPNPFRVAQPPPPAVQAFPNFHPLKGPMTTQSLRGMANHGPMHWRGDRTGGNDVGGSALDEKAAFGKFIVAFEGLLGRDAPIDGSLMGAFTDFILEVTYPPNPIRALDNTLTPDQQTGHDFYFGATSDVFQNCNGCHRLDPANGFFGSDGFMSFENEVQLFKIPHLRNLYQKVGMFGMPAVPFFNAGDNGHKGDQVRGFGFLHDGSTDTLFRFHNAAVFNQVQFGFPVNPGGFPNGAPGDPLRRQVEQFMLAFDSNLAPIVGQQTTLSASNGGVVGPRIDLLIARAVAGECDVIVKGTLAGEQRGWVRQAGGTFRSDRVSEALLSDVALRAQAGTAGQERTYTCVPPGSGVRAGVDRDQDGFFDRDELDAGSDPADPGSFPGATTTTTSTTLGGTTTTSSTASTAPSTTTTLPTVTIQTTSLTLKDDNDPPIQTRKRRISFSSSTRLDPLANRIVPPARGSAGDPTIHGGTLLVYNSSGLTDDIVAVVLPAAGPEPGAGWKAIGSAANPRGYRYKGEDPEGPIKRVLVKENKITIRGGKGNWVYSLDEAQQGRVAIQLQLGTTIAWCADAPAKSKGNPPSTAQYDKVDKFVAARKTPAPGVCPSPF